MSFGYSVSDAVFITQLAWKALLNSRKAFGEHDDFTHEVSSLHLVLQRLQQEIGKAAGPLNRPADSSSNELQSIVDGCERVLKRVNTILKKHDALKEKDNSGRKLWQKVRFGNGQMQELAQLRTKISYYVSALTLFLNMVSTGSIGRVEKKMDDAGGDLTDIRIAVNGITAHLMAKSHQEGSVMTAYPDDDKTAYIKELGNRGLLDDLVVQSDVGPERMPTLSETKGGSETATETVFDTALASGSTMHPHKSCHRRPSLLPRRAQERIRQAERAPQAHEPSDSNIQSKPPYAFVATGSSESESNGDRIGELEPNSTRNNSTTDGNEVDPGYRDSDKEDKDLVSESLSDGGDVSALKGHSFDHETSRRRHTQTTSSAFEFFIKGSEHRLTELDAMKHHQAYETVSGTFSTAVLR